MPKGSTFVDIIKAKYYFNSLAFTVLPARSDSNLMFCLQSYQGLRIDRSLEY